MKIWERILGKCQLSRRSPLLGSAAAVVDEILTEQKVKIIITTSEYHEFVQNNIFIMAVIVRYTWVEKCKCAQDEWLTVNYHDSRNGSEIFFSLFLTRKWIPTVSSTGRRITKRQNNNISLYSSHRNNNIVSCSCIIFVFLFIF